MCVCGTGVGCCDLLGRWVDWTSGSRVHDVGTTFTCSRVPGSKARPAGTSVRQPRTRRRGGSVWHSCAPEVVVRIANGQVRLQRLLWCEREPAVQCRVLLRAWRRRHHLPGHGHVNRASWVLAQRYTRVGFNAGAALQYRCILVRRTTVTSGHTPTRVIGLLDLLVRPAARRSARGTASAPHHPVVPRDFPRRATSRVIGQPLVSYCFVGYAIRNTLR